MIHLGVHYQVSLNTASPGLSLRLIKPSSLHHHYSYGHVLLSSTDHVLSCHCHCLTAMAHVSNGQSTTLFLSSTYTLTHSLFLFFHSGKTVRCSFGTICSPSGTPFSSINRSAPHCDHHSSTYKHTVQTFYS